MAKAKKEEAKSTNTDFGAFIDDITKGVDRISNMNPNDEIRWLSCYSAPINIALSGHPEKGLPMGRIINFEGESDTGKTLIGLTAMREAQETYGSRFRGLIIDTERGMDLARLEKLGMFTRKKPANPKKPDVAAGEDTTGDPRAGTLRVIQMTDVSTLVDKILLNYLNLARQQPEYVFILMIDSVSMLVTTHERESAHDTRDMARAQELRKMMRLLNDGYAPNLTVLLVHHQSDRISTTGMLAAKQGNHNKDIGGGKAMKYVPSVRIEVNYGGKAYRGNGDNKKIIGQICKVEVVKTRLNKPMIKAEAIISHEYGFTQLGGLFDQLVQLKVVIEIGNYVQCPALYGEKKMFKAALEEELEQPENAAKVVKLISERVQFSTAGGEGDASEAPDIDDEKPLPPPAVVASLDGLEN